MRAIQRYFDAYKGLSREIWMLSLVMLINRSGAMVLPFLSVYLKGPLQFSTEEVGILLTLFGLGSLAGTFIGGYLTDRFGFFRVQFFSLMLTGAGYIALESLNDFSSLAVGFFLITLISDCFRPANASAIAAFSNPDNVTRAYSLNRMAINLGFTIGPALGGLVALYSFSWLFYIDGLSCCIGGLLFFSYFRGNVSSEAKAPKTDLSQVDPISSPYRDRGFLWVVALTAVFALVFFQFIFTLPLYYREEAALSEAAIGLLLGLNGLVVFSLEMPLVQYFGRTYSLRFIICAGCLLTAVAFGILAFNHALGALIVSMIILSIGEIFVMPFLSTYTAQRSNSQNRGKYMGLYGMAYSSAFVLAPGLGAFLSGSMGYRALWMVTFVLGSLGALGFWWKLKPKLSVPQP